MKFQKTATVSPRFAIGCQANAERFNCKIADVVGINESIVNITILYDNITDLQALNNAAKTYRPTETKP